MYHHRFRKPSKKTTFALLMLGSLVMIALPSDFFASARNMTQLVALPQYGVTRAADAVAESAKSFRNEVVPAKEHAELLRASKALENEYLAMQSQLMLLQAENAQLRWVRQRPGFPADGRLIPARVIGWDAVPDRDSMLLTKGRSANVRKGDWVTSRLAVQAGSDSGIREDLRAVARETLIGWVEQAGSYTSRVVLLSDRYTNRVWRVRIAAIGRPNRPPAEYVLDDNNEQAVFALEGIGDGKMRIHDIDAAMVKNGRIRVGDAVITDNHDPKLPLDLVIGDIVELEQIKKQPLLYQAIVQHRWELKDISDVFIVDVSH